MFQLVQPATLHKMSSTFSITTYLDELQPPVQKTFSNNTDAFHVDSAADLKVEPNIAQPSGSVSECVLGYNRMPEVKTFNEEIGTTSCASIPESPVDSSLPTFLSKETSMDDMSDNTFGKHLHRCSDLDPPAAVLCIASACDSDVKIELDGTESMDCFTFADAQETFSINESLCIDHNGQHKDTAFNYIDVNKMSH